MYSLTPTLYTVFSCFLWRTQSCVQRRDSDLLRSRNSTELVGQDGILRPIGNRPSRKLHFTPRRPINNRLQDSILPHYGSCGFRIDSEIPAPPQEVRVSSGSLEGFPTSNAKLTRRAMFRSAVQFAPGLLMA